MDFQTWLSYVFELLPGLGTAMQLTGVSLALGFPIALAFALLIQYGPKILTWLVIAVVEIGRGVPLLVLLYIFYQGLPQVDIYPSAMVAAIIAFTWSAAAYATETIRSSIQSVPNGQMEAASAVGLTAIDRFRHVILPQASRIAIPPLMGLAVVMFQLTSLAYVITISEVMQAAYFLGTQTLNYLPIFVAAAFVYATITIPASAAVTMVEKKLSKHI